MQRSLKILRDVMFMLALLAPSLSAMTHDLDLVTAHLGSRSFVTNPAVALHPSLTVAPQRRTVLPGESITFEALGETKPITWFLVDDFSGATTNITSVNTMVYTAGTNAGVVDIVQAWDGTNRFARSFVNVISADDVAKLGKAVIVAGGKSRDDPVWEATDYVARKAYDVLRYRGYFPEGIQYLSFDPLVPNADGGATTETVSDTFTNWVTDASQLFVYMANHGSSSQSGLGVFRLNAGQQLAAATLDDWLDDLQDADTNVAVTVVLDFCYSGSFIDELSYTGTARRVVIASTSPDELTYFIGGGIVSFSDAFFNGLLLGKSLRDAYRQARDSMTSYQNATMDDNKDGLSNAFDGNVATNVVGASFIAGKDIPIIGKVLGTQLLTAGTVATLWADDISSAYALNRVWCNVLAPSHAPNTNSAVPVIDIPEIDLDYDLNAGRHAADYAGFSEQGNYKVAYYAKDIWDSVSLPKLTTVIQQGAREDLILIAAGTTNATDWQSIDTIASYTYGTALSRLFEGATVHYFSAGQSDLDRDGTNDVDGLPTIANIRAAFTNDTIGSRKLSMVIIGNEASGELVLNDSESLSASRLNSWLDVYQSSNFPVQVVLEFDSAAGWISQMPPPPERERIIFASTRANRETFWGADGLVSFTRFFMSDILQGATVGDAFQRAKLAIRRASGRLRQQAAVEDSGNGRANEKNVDGVLAKRRFMGPAFVTGDDIPAIGEAIPSQVIHTNSLTLWASDVLDIDGISNVWCLVTRPDYDGFTALPRVDMAYNGTLDRYEGDYSLFNRSGVFTLSFFAIDNLGQESAPVQSDITVSVPFDQPDIYEIDDTVAQASMYQVAQVHTFHTANDVDWVRTYLVSNYVYDIETIHHGTNLDSVITLYRELPDGTVTNLDTIDQSGNEDGEFTGLDNPQNGFYRIKISQFPQSTWTAAGYTLIINVPAGNGSFLVMAVNALTGQPLPAGALTRVDGATETHFNGQASLALDLSAGPHTIEVVPPPGYLPIQSTIIPAEVQNPDSDIYGNPRAIVPEGLEIMASGFAPFAFMPATWLTGSVRDQWTGAYVSDAEIVLRPLSGITNHLDRFPHFATYTNPWRTHNGQFPSNVIGFAGVDYDILVTHTDYSNLVVQSALASTAPGDIVHSGWHSLVPVDADGNGVPDGWELRHVGTNVLATTDTDGDGITDRNEYRSGTNPTNAASVLRTEMADPASPTGGLRIVWGVVPGLAYELSCGSNLVSGLDSIVYGPATATVGQAEMSYTDPTADATAKRFYRIGVRRP